MNMHIEIQKLEPSGEPAKPGILRQIQAFLARVLSSPKGDHGGREGGARGQFSRFRRTAEDKDA